MECSTEATGSNNSTVINYSPSPPPSCSPSSSPPSPVTQAAAAATTPVVISPCAACKILRRRCADKCVLAPYFPPTEPAKFTIAHRVFGASNIIKFLQELPESQRADAVSSMVYEASARIRDPVYGCAGAICQLQKQVSELQAQLAKTQAELVNMQCQQANLVALLCMEMAQSSSTTSTSLLQPSSSSSPMTVDNFINNNIPPSTTYQSNPNCFLDENNLASIWDQPLWT